MSDVIAPALTMNETVLHAFSTAPHSRDPFSYWEVHDMLPAEDAQTILDISLPQPKAFMYDGTRAGDAADYGVVEDVNRFVIPPKRMFVTPEIAARYPVFQRLVEALLAPALLKTVYQHFGLDTTGLFLRVEYINDYDGFYLVPHKDIVEKKLSLLLYLGDAPEYMGTDLYYPDLTVAKTLKFTHNYGFIFLPGDDTWHGLEKKFIPTRRCSLLINYVTFKTDWPISMTP